MAMIITTIKVEMESWVKKMLCEKKKRTNNRNATAIGNRIPVDFSIIISPGSVC